MSRASEAGAPNDDRCSRCGGLLVREQESDEGLLSGFACFAGWRCLQCGDRIDPVIIEHRRERAKGNIALDAPVARSRS